MRKKVPKKVVIEVLTEAGYRCAVQTCRNIFAIDIHHSIEVVEGVGNELANLIALCPTCHALFHRGKSLGTRFYSWKRCLILYEKHDYEKKFPNGIKVYLVHIFIFCMHT